jgi:hypothetical protein
MYRSIAPTNLDEPNDMKVPETWQLASLGDLVSRIEAGKNMRGHSGPPCAQCPAFSGFGDCRFLSMSGNSR